MTTTLKMLTDTERHLYAAGTARDQRNRLASLAATNATSLTFTYDLKAIRDGASVSVDFERFYVWAVDDGAKTATVSAGQDGTTAASHASGAMATVNARFDRFSILGALNDELADLSSYGLFRPRPLDITAVSARAGYDLNASDLEDVLKVQYEAVGGSLDWPTLPRGAWSFSRDMATSEFASGKAFFLYDYVPPGRTVRIWYRAPFGSLTTTTTENVETVTGLPAAMHDILPLGAAVRLLAGRPVKRTFTESQGDTRRAEEVSTQDTLAAPARLQQLHDARVSRERNRLAREWPIMLARH